MTRQGAHDSSRESEARYRDLALACDQAVILSAEGRIVFANDAAVGLLGATRSAQILDQELRLFVTHDRSDSAVASGSEHGAQVQLPITRLDGATITVSLAWMPCRYEGRDGVQIIVRDIAERRSLERQVQFLTRNDLLTEMPNRTDFRDRLVGAMARAKRNSRHVAVMTLNIDRFNAINAKVGHDNGDEILRTVAARLKSSICKADAAARVGGD